LGRQCMMSPPLGIRAVEGGMHNIRLTRLNHSLKSSAKDNPKADQKGKEPENPEHQIFSLPDFLSLTPNRSLRSRPSPARPIKQASPKKVRRGHRSELSQQPKRERETRTHFFRGTATCIKPQTSTPTARFPYPSAIETRAE
jgi:hypothetical protein